MEILNAFSDVILLVVCLYVFFKYINHLDFATTILWESFILSVAVAAFFGALDFLGFEKAQPISIFFQKLANINGAIGLVGGSVALVSGTDFSRWGSYMFIILGFVFFTLYEVFDVRSIYFAIPVICMAIVFILALFALIKGKTRVGLWLLAGVVFFALASFRKEIFGINNFSISLFHLLLSAGVLSLGMANAGVSLIRRT